MTVGQQRDGEVSQRALPSVGALFGQISFQGMECSETPYVPHSDTPGWVCTLLYDCA